MSGQRAEALADHIGQLTAQVSELQAELSRLRAAQGETPQKVDPERARVYWELSAQEIELQNLGLDHALLSWEGVELLRELAATFQENYEQMRLLERAANTCAAVIIARESSSAEARLNAFEESAKRLDVLSRRRSGAK